MSNNSLALAPARNWRHGNEFAASNDHDPRQSGSSSSVPWPLSYRRGEGGGIYAPWRLFEERVRTGPYGLTRFPSQPHSAIRILVLDDGTPDRVSPRLRQFIRDSPLRTRGDWHIRPSAPVSEESGLNDDEFNNAMKKLKKQVYTPPYPKRGVQKKGLFRNWSNNNNNNHHHHHTVAESEKNEDKECAICLEAFVATEQVLVTPCNHMFHEYCLIPWVKSRGQCPVCRFMLCERREVTGTRTLANNNMGDGVDVGGSADLIALTRALEEAFNWVALFH